MVAGETNIHQQRVCDVLASFVNHIVCELMNGRCVSIPGFGALVARPSKARPGCRQRVYIAFTASRNLFVTISERARVEEPELKVWNTFRKNHRPSGRAYRRIKRDPGRCINLAWNAIMNEAIKTPFLNHIPWYDTCLGPRALEGE
jgi:hypothetical protein